MSEKRERHRASCRTTKVDRNLLSLLSTNIPIGTKMEVNIVDMHSYARPQSPDCVPLPDSITSTPAPKKGRPEPTLAKLQENIVRLLVEKINERADGLEKKADDLEKLIKHNTESIDALKENAEFLLKEIQDMKTDVTTVKKVTTDHERRISELEDKMNDA